MSQSHRQEKQGVNNKSAIDIFIQKQRAADQKYGKLIGKETQVFEQEGKEKVSYAF